MQRKCGYGQPTTLSRCNIILRFISTIFDIRTYRIIYRNVRFGFVYHYRWINRTIVKNYMQQNLHKFHPSLHSSLVILLFFFPARIHKENPII